MLTEALTKVKTIVELDLLELNKKEFPNVNKKTENSLKIKPEETKQKVLMHIFKGGKHTFVLQPKSQQLNLQASGWETIKPEEILEILKPYSF